MTPKVIDLTNVKPKTTSKIVDVSGIVPIRSQTERPVTQGPPTQRSLCAESPANRDLVKKIGALKGMWEIIDSSQFQQCVDDLFQDDYPVLNTLKQLKKELTELLIRFDTNPQNYTKTDFTHLMAVLCRSLLFIYKTMEMWGNLKSTDEDVLKIEKFDDHIEWQPQVGTLETDKDELDWKKEDRKKIAKIDDIRNYISNKLTWIER